MDADAPHVPAGIGIQLYRKKNRDFSDQQQFVVAFVLRYTKGVELQQQEDGLRRWAATCRRLGNDLEKNRWGLWVGAAHQDPTKLHCEINEWRQLLLRRHQCESWQVLGRNLGVNDVKLTFTTKRDDYFCNSQALSQPRVFWWTPKFRAYMFTWNHWVWNDAKTAQEVEVSSVLGRNHCAQRQFPPQRRSDDEAFI